MGSARETLVMERYSIPPPVELFDTERKVRRSEARRKAKNVGLALLAKYRKSFDSRLNRMSLSNDIPCGDQGYR